MWEYVKQWRDLVAQVYPSLLDKKIITLFANTLKSRYCEHMMYSLTNNLLMI
jgi:hypothetical protein